MPPGCELLGGPFQQLDGPQVQRFISEQVAALDVAGKRVCLIVPDATRTCPLPLLLPAFHTALCEASVSMVVALGTHQPMSDEHLTAFLGGRYPGWDIRNHEFWRPETFATLGTIPASRIAELTNGLLTDRSVEVRINRLVAEAELAIVIGPVFPHEVVGFSGGNKYFFPGVSAQEMIDVSHWIGALISSASIIGTRGITPVRALIDEAAAMIPAERRALCLVVESGTDTLHAMAFGAPEQAWAAAADISAQAHITYLDAPVPRVLAVMPRKYEDIWTAAKGFYKLEPIVADGGEVIIYAPHITQLSVMHPHIAEIGYHCRDYFLGQWDRFKELPWGDLAHSSHVRGQGTWDPVGGEVDRVQVAFATSIPREVVEAANVGYLDPASVDVSAMRADPDTFVELNAGEVLYRLRQPSNSSATSP